MSDTYEPETQELTVRLPASLLAQVDAAARARGVGRSVFVRQALASETAAVLGPQAEESLYELLSADGVLGRFSVPAGLSTTARATLRERIQRHQKKEPGPEIVVASGTAERLIKRGRRASGGL